MLIFFIRKNKTDERTCPPKNDQDHLREHNKDMKRFRLAHPKESISARDMITADGNILATLHTVKLTKHTQN